MENSLRHYVIWPYNISNCPGRLYHKGELLGCSLCGTEVKKQDRTKLVMQSLWEVESKDQYALDVVRHFAIIA